MVQQTISDQLPRTTGVDAAVICIFHRSPLKDAPSLDGGKCVNSLRNGATKLV